MLTTSLCWELNDKYYKIYHLMNNRSEKSFLKTYIQFYNLIKKENVHSHNFLLVLMENQ